ncbi:MAG: HVO_0476 family zinc finger protein [Candidatus Thermoplasmatota archaeon]|nr:HVO_0476 family zinc finger protein [Candidatus Thermoplasmatota archaeon]
MRGAEIGETGIADCPSCSGKHDHEVIKSNPKGKGEDLLVKCKRCGSVHMLMLRPPKAVKVKTTLSDGKRSFRAEIEADEDEEISIGDVFEHDGISWKITRIDDSGSKERRVMNASEIFSMWATRCDIVSIGITMTDGEFSESTKIECEPERVFSCGSIMMVEGRKWRVRGIHTGKGRTLTGSREAGQIRRIYLHKPS